MKTPHRSSWVLSALLGVLPSFVARAESNAMSSPFLPPGGAAAAAPASENTPLEWRGVIDLGGGNFLYGLFDPAKRQGSWVKVNEGDHGFTVRSHDASNESITVEYQGRVMNLALKQAKIESMGVVQALPPPGQPMPQPGQPGQPQRGPQPVALNPTPADEAKRLEGVAAEVRRRRALRQAAAQQQQQTPQAPAPQPAPAQPQR